MWIIVSIFFKKNNKNRWFNIWKSNYLFGLFDCGEEDVVIEIEGSSIIDSSDISSKSGTIKFLKNLNPTKLWKIINSK